MLTITTAYLMFVYVEACNPQAGENCTFNSKPVEAYKDANECEQEAYRRNKENLSYMYGEFWKCYLYEDEMFGETK